MAGVADFSDLLKGLARLYDSPLSPGAQQGTSEAVTPPFQPPPGTDPTAGTSGFNPGAGSGAVPPVPPINMPWNPTGKYPNAIWGGDDNMASHTAPKWLQDLVNQYKANPSHQLWDHLVNGTGVKAPYSSLQMPDWLKQWLVQTMGPDPSVSSGGGV